jgi:hypothetical protein
MTVRHAGVRTSFQRSSQPERSRVSVLLAFDVAVQTIAAFVIFVVGYAALFGTLSVCFAITMGLYEGAKRIWASTGEPCTGLKSFHRRRQNEAKH